MSLVGTPLERISLLPEVGDISYVCLCLLGLIIKKLFRVPCFPSFLLLVAHLARCGPFAQTTIIYYLSRFIRQRHVFQACVSIPPTS